jgi:hypothetical protein
MRHLFRFPVVFAVSACSHALTAVSLHAVIDPRRANQPLTASVFIVNDGEAPVDLEQAPTGAYSVVVVDSSGAQVAALHLDTSGGVTVWDRIPSTKRFRTHVKPHKVAGERYVDAAPRDYGRGARLVATPLLSLEHGTFVGDRSISVLVPPLSE